METLKVKLPYYLIEITNWFYLNLRVRLESTESSDLI